MANHKHITASHFWQLIARFIAVKVSSSDKVYNLNRLVF